MGEIMAEMIGLLPDELIVAILNMVQRDRDMKSPTAEIIKNSITFKCDLIVFATTRRWIEHEAVIIPSEMYLISPDADEQFYDEEWKLSKECLLQKNKQEYFLHILRTDRPQEDDSDDDSDDDVHSDDDSDEEQPPPQTEEEVERVLRERERQREMELEDMRTYWRS